MAFQKEQLSQNLIGGSVNWAPPGDKIPPNDALEIRNFRSDKPGQLVSRRGTARVTGSPASQTDVHTLFRRPGSVGLFVGAGANFYGDNGASLIRAGGSGDPLGLAAHLGWLWFTDRNGFSRYRPGESPSVRAWTPPVGPAPADLAPNALGALEGEYFAAVSVEGDDGFEGRLGTSIGPITLSAQGLSLTVPVGSLPWIAKRHLYLSGGSLGSGNSSGFWRAKTINDNVTTAVSFNGSEDDITDIGIEGRTDIFNPGIALGIGDPFGNPFGVAGPYYQRLIVYSSGPYPNRYAWSLFDDSRGTMPWAFSPDSWSNLGDRDARIWWVSLHRRALVFYKEDSIWRVIGDPASANAVEEETNAQRGALGPRAVAKIGAIDAFAAADGIFTFDLDNERRISQKIDPIFKGDHVVPSANLVFPALTSDAAARARSVLYYAQDLLHFNYAEQGQSYPNVTLVYNPQNGDWSRKKLASGIGSTTAPRAMVYHPLNAALYAGLRDGHIYRLDQGTTDHGSAIPLTYISHYHHQGAPDNGKVYGDIAIDFSTGGAAITVKALLDHGASEIAVGSLSSVSRVRKSFPLNLTEPGKGIRGRNLALYLDGQASSEVRIYEATLHFRIERRDGRTFDTGLIDWGDDRVKVLEAIEFEVEATNVINWAVYGSLRSFGAGLITSGSKAAPGTARIPLLVNLTTLVEAQNLELVLSSASEFQLHHCRLKLRPIGEYLVGQAGEVYDSGAVAVGI